MEEGKKGKQKLSADRESGKKSKNTFPKPSSGVPNSSGGSREGNIGHQGDDNGGNSHR
jgi:hypothetical protein